MLVYSISLFNKKITAMLAHCSVNFEGTVRINKITSKVLINEAFGVAHGYYNDGSIVMLN